MTSALSPPLVVAALVLCIAGAAKLRSPSSAREALRGLGVIVPRWGIRLFALAELGLGGWTAARPTAPGAAAVGALYCAFACLSMLLARRQAACGCFGDGELPASTIQVAFSAALALGALAAAVFGPRGLVWVAGQGALGAAVVIAGCGACAYGVVLGYTRLPEAWLSWSGT